MEAISKIAERLMEITKPDTSWEKEALTTRIYDSLIKMFRYDDMPKDIDLFFDEGAETGMFLRTWCMAKVQEGVFSDDRFKPLFSVGAFLDWKAASDMPLLAFVPNYFFVFNDEKATVRKPQLDLISVAPGQSRMTEVQRTACKLFIHPNLTRSLQGCNHASAILYSFTLFIMDVFIDVRGGSLAELRDGLEKVRSGKKSVPPALPDILKKILQSTLTDLPLMTCRDLITAIISGCRQNPALFHPEIDRKIRHEWSAQSVIGLNKKEQFNEDRFYTCTGKNMTFMFVADGVSTADLGTGALAADEILRVFRDNYVDRFDAFAEKWRADDDIGDWSKEADKMLKEFFRDSNMAVIKGINDRLMASSGKEYASPMCSTLTAAIIFYDQAVLRYTGDSPVFLFSPGRQAFWKLTTDHNVGMEQKFSFTGESQKDALTRVIGACQYDEKQSRFKPLEETGDPLRVQLCIGDILILASDGLVSCIDGASEMLKMKRLEQELLDSHQDQFRKLIRRLVSLGENGSSHDNITVNALKIWDGKQ
ncbi:MAG: PP2C family protein-serine/threonine phosphatase [Syntrophales bacterium]